jgi:hypothetical protein
MEFCSRDVWKYSKFEGDELRGVILYCECG